MIPSVINKGTQWHPETPVEFGEVFDIPECHPPTGKDGEGLVTSIKDSPSKWMLGRQLEKFQMLVKDAIQTKDAVLLSLKWGPRPPSSKLRSSI
jgi:hypothetical protein